MTMDGRTESLQRRHAKLDQQIETASKGPMPDHDEIQRLKTLRLDAKDKLHGIKPDA